MTAWWLWSLFDHLLGQGAGIRGQTRDGDADVVVDLQDLLLVGRQLVRGPLESRQHHIIVRTQAQARRTLPSRPARHDFSRSASKLSPPRQATTTTQPGRYTVPIGTARLTCFTASMAYSTWCKRPCGLHTVTSVSYWLRNMAPDLSSCAHRRATQRKAEIRHHFPAVWWSCSGIRLFSEFDGDHDCQATIPWQKATRTYNS